MRAEGLFLLLVVMGTTCVSKIWSQTCPYVDKNCKCLNETLECSKLSNIPALNRGADVFNITILKFNDGYIQKIPGNSLPSGLEEFEIRDNPLTDISPDAFAASETTLNRVAITNAKITRLPNAFANLTSLNTLFITFTNIHDWNTDVLYRLSGTLEFLFLSNVPFPKWPVWLYNFTSLNSLHLSDANLSSIPDDAFNVTKDKLIILDLASNHLTELPAALSNLTKLTSLDLSGNSLKNIARRPAIEFITSLPFAELLEDLSIGESGLTVIPRLSNLTKLTHLDLDFNLIPEIIPDNLPSDLAIINLSFNSITEIRDTDFRNLTKLEYLDLGENPISKISSSAFSNLDSLETLVLSGAKVSQLPEALLSLKSLRKLDLSSIKTLQCPCPLEPEWIEWFNSTYAGTKFEIEGKCNNRKSIQPYLVGTCQVEQATTPGHGSNTGSAVAPMFISSSLFILFRSCLHTF